MRSICFARHTNAVLSYPLRKLRKRGLHPGTHLADRFTASLLAKPRASSLSCANHSFGIAAAAGLTLRLKIISRNRRNMILTLAPRKTAHRSSAEQPRPEV